MKIMIVEFIILKIHKKKSEEIIQGKNIIDKYEWDTINRHINLTTKRINKQKSS